MTAKPPHIQSPTSTLSHTSRTRWEEDIASLLGNAFKMVIRRKVDFSQSQVDKRKKKSQRGRSLWGDSPCPGALYRVVFWWACGVTIRREMRKRAGCWEVLELPLVVWAEQKKPVWTSSPHQCKLQAYPGTFALLFAPHCEFQKLPQDVWRFFQWVTNPPAQLVLVSLIGSEPLGTFSSTWTLERSGVTYALASHRQALSHLGWS